jgi:hypothetical protein
MGYLPMIKTFDRMGYALLSHPTETAFSKKIVSTKVFAEGSHFKAAISTGL